MIWANKLSSRSEGEEAFTFILAYNVWGTCAAGISVDALIYGLTDKGPSEFDSLGVWELKAPGGPAGDVMLQVFNDF